jgi:uncharacterized membrane protein YebE (DUF533 family)
MDTKKLLEILTKNPAAGAAMGGLAGSLLGNVLGGGGNRGSKKLVKYGGLAAIGYVAYQAWQKNQAQKAGRAATGAPAPASLDALLGSVLGGGAAGAGAAGAAGAGEAGVASAAARPALPPAFDLESGANAAAALKIVQAMIAASKADGVLDAQERERIFARVGEYGLGQAEQDDVLRLMTQPADLDAIVRGVDSKELATEIYAAALVAITPANRAERAWLDMLAARLGLESDLTLELDRSVAALAERA